MPNVKANGIQIEYDTFGDSASPALLLVMGAGGRKNADLLLSHHPCVGGT